MAKFDNLQSLLEHLETDALEEARPWKLQLLIGELLRGPAPAPAPEQGGFDAARCEYDVFCLKFENGELDSHCNHILQEFLPQAYAYVAARLAATTNPVLKHQYAHVLWCRRDGQKQIKHARIAIESYLRAAQGYEQHARKQHARKTGNLPYGVAMSCAIRNAYGLAAQTSQPLAEIKAEILRLAKRFKTVDTWLFRVRHELITLILRERKHFEDGELSGLQDTCWRLVQRCTKLGREWHLSSAIDMIDLGQKLDQRLKRTSHNWDLARAKCYERLMGMREPGDCARPRLCLDAIQSYRKAGRENKARVLEGQYPDIARSVQLACFGISVDMTDTMVKAHKLAEEVASLSQGEVVAFLASQADLLPRHDDVRRMLSQGITDSLLTDATSATIDDRGHLTEYCATPEEHEERETLRLYARQLHSRHLPIIHGTIVSAIAADGLSIETLREYLQRSSWLCKDVEAQSPTKGKYRYRWWDLLEPSLAGYLGKMRQWLADQTRIPNLVLEIDSLTLKFEGLVRDLLQRGGTPTFQRKRHDSDLTEEKYVGNLLSTNDARHVFTEDDHLFLRFLLTEDNGCDLRNRIAHCLLCADDYHIEYMHLLLLALLRLSKYDLTPAANGHTET